MIKVFGIKNCDTVKKSLKWFDSKNIDIEFIDFKKQPPTERQLARWNQTLGWEALLNKRGTTWRKLPKEIKSSINERLALKLMQENASIIKRPVVEQISTEQDRIEKDNLVTCGFLPEEWEKHL